MQCLWKLSKISLWCFAEVYLGVTTFCVRKQAEVVQLCLSRLDVARLTWKMLCREWSQSGHNSDTHLQLIHIYTEIGTNHNLQWHCVRSSMNPWRPFLEWQRSWPSGAANKPSEILRGLTCKVSWEEKISFIGNIGAGAAQHNESQQTVWGKVSLSAKSPWQNIYSLCV